jgi:hypothetical protein
MHLSKLLPRKYGRSSQLNVENPLLPDGIASQPKVDKAATEKAEAERAEALAKALEKFDKWYRYGKRASSVEP